MVQPTSSTKKTLFCTILFQVKIDFDSGCSLDKWSVPLINSLASLTIRLPLVFAITPSNGGAIYRYQQLPLPFIMRHDEEDLLISSCAIKRTYTPAQSL
jgi:hypothetical protein